MKKILLAFDGTHFSDSAFKFARSLNDKDPILLTGVFVPLVNYASLWSFATASAAVGAPAIPLLEEEEITIVQKNIERFESLCRKYNIEYRTHRDYNDFAVPELKKETRYADLLIVGSETFYDNIGATGPGSYLNDLLPIAECPILIVPEQFSFPENNVLAFDGSASSVYAIKQFAYLFPELCANDTLLIYLEDDEKPIPDQAYIEELVARHFPQLTICKLELPSTKYFPIWANARKNAILVSGAFGRSSVSQIFRKSFITDVIKDHKLPIFIAHR